MQQVISTTYKYTSKKENAPTNRGLFHDFRFSLGYDNLQQDGISEAVGSLTAPLLKKALSCRRKRLLLTTEKRETHPARHKSRRKNSMRPSRAYRRRNWDTGTTNRKRTPRTRHGLRAAALTRLTTPARPPKTRTRHRRNVKRRLRCSPTWRARSCTRK